jgi:hypothetical protein
MGHEHRDPQKGGRVMSDLAPDDWNERYKLARLDARDGFGWQDLVVRYSISSAAAKIMVVEAEYTRLEQVKDARP